MSYLSKTLRSTRRQRKERRHELEAKLADCGLLRPRAVDPFTEDESIGHRLGRFFASAEPAWRLFGRYLGSRLDLFAAEDAFRLAELEGHWPRRSFDDLRQVIREELAADPETLFASIDPTPRHTAAGWQCHAAVLAAGRQAQILLAPSPQAVDDALEHLSLLRPALGDLAFDGLVDDFRQPLAADLVQRAAALNALQGGPSHLDGFRTPCFEPILSSRSLLTREVVTATPLDGLDDGPLARRLVGLWLQQTLQVGQCPLPDELRHLDDGGLVIGDGRVVEISASVQPALWQYLRATAQHRSQEAWHHLMPLIAPQRDDADADQLGRRIRQIVPFRDGCWSERGDGLAEYLMLHWRALGEQGFVATPPLLAFYRGVADLARRCRGAADRDGDPWRQAVDDLHWKMSWGQWQSFADPKKLGLALEGQLTSFLDLPAKLDAVLDRLGESADSNRSAGSSGADEASPARGEDHTVTVATLGLSMASVALLGQRVTTPWMQELCTLIFLLLGAWLLRTALVAGR